MERPGTGLHDPARFAALTPRERDVMAHIATGKPNKIIAAELGVSQRTIEAHRARVFRKLRVRNAVELAHCLLGASPVQPLSMSEARHATGPRAPGMRHGVRGSSVRGAPSVHR